MSAHSINFIWNHASILIQYYVYLGASTRFKHTTCYAYFNDEYRSCLYSLIQLGVIYATQIFFNKPYVSNLGAHGSSYYCKCLTVITYEFQPIVYEMSAHSINFTWNYASILIPYYVSLGTTRWKYLISESY